MCVCVCAQAGMNTRSWSGAVACKAAREAGGAGQDSAESACLRPLTGRRGEYMISLLLGGAGDTERQQPHIC